MNILDYIQNYNSQQLPSIHNSFTLYKQTGIIDYPRDNNKQIQAMIFPTLKDYKPLEPNAPIFVDFNGKTINYQGNSTVYPVFIGEAAYVEKGIAMSLTRKETVTI